ncbi:MULTISPECIES: hypothetical protein [Nitrosomonas]|nr:MULTISPECIES: hypothetical protein [Nitrosomonas]UVS61134.1 hypothetical protein NX761_16855 [Nitrosomonas sp. PLL12]
MAETKVLILAQEAIVKALIKCRVLRVMAYLSNTPEPSVKAINHILQY